MAEEAAGEEDADAEDVTFESLGVNDVLCKVPLNLLIVRTIEANHLPLGLLRIEVETPHKDPTGIYPCRDPGPLVNLIF